MKHYLLFLAGGVIMALMVNPAPALADGDCRYIPNAPVLQPGQSAPLQCDTNGNLKTTSSGSGGGNVDLTGINGVTPSTGIGPSNTGTLRVAPVVGASFAPAPVALNNATATQVLAASSTPIARQVCNVDPAIIEYIGPTGVTTSTGLQILPGGCWDISHTTVAIFAIAQSGTPNMTGVQY